MNMIRYVLLIELSEHCTRGLCISQHRIFNVDALAGNGQGRTNTWDKYLRLVVFEWGIINDVDARIAALGGGICYGGCWRLSDAN